MKNCYTYDDVLLVPQYSDIKSRNEVSLNSKLNSFNDDEDSVIFKLPIISSPMDTVTEDIMANAMYNAGGFGIIHRYNTILEQVEIFNKSPYSGCAVGVTGDYLERTEALYNAGCRIICIDIAHGHHILMKEAIKSIKEKFPEVHIMAGNIATKQGFADLQSWGADSIRVGIGGGSICSTRIETGHGVPNLTAIKACKKAQKNAKIIADGGIKTSGDIVKALAAGADFVMLGSLLAGTDESPGQIINENGQKKKVYRGMASPEAQKAWKGSVNSNEGIQTTIPYKGSVKDILIKLEKGIKSGLSYSGSRNIEELRKKAKFIQQSNSSLQESQTHILLRNK
jgi:IMP dehydrogenase